MQTQRHKMTKKQKKFLVKQEEVIKVKLTDMQYQKISEQKKAIAAGYDAEILPSITFEIFEKEVQKLVEDFK